MSRLPALLTAAACVVTACTGAPPKPTAEFARFGEFDQAVHVSAPRKALPSARRAPAAAHAQKRPGPAATPRRAPFVPGESSTLDLRFAGMSAGELTLETAPPAMVNGRKSYVFTAKIKSNKIFSLFFRINDEVRVYYDASRLVPLTTTLHVEENHKLSETRTHFDWAAGRVDEWENSLENKEPLKHRDKHWKLAPESQSLLSTIYALRARDLAPGATVRFPISHDEKTFEFVGEILRRESVDTPLGKKATVVVQAADGLTNLFSKAQGSTLLWLSDDERHALVRLEAPLRFGKLTGLLKAESPGAPPANASGARPQDTASR